MMITKATASKNFPSLLKCGIGQASWIQKPVDTGNGKNEDGCVKSGRDVVNWRMHTI